MSSLGHGRWRGWTTIDRTSSATISSLKSSDSRNRYSSLLEDLLTKLKLRDSDLSGQIVDESPYPVNQHGAYSDIYTGKSLKHGGAKVAIKKMRGIFLGEKAIKVRLQCYLLHLDHNPDKQIVWREIYNWSSCSNENVVPFFGYILQETCDVPALISPWMERGTLSSVLESEEEIDELAIVSRNPCFL